MREAERPQAEGIGAGRYAGTVPIEQSIVFVETLEVVAPGHTVMVLSGDGVAELWVEPPLSRSQWDDWESVVEASLDAAGEGADDEADEGRSAGRVA